MGGDGGVIASNRKYMRGAGTADHTADRCSGGGGGGGSGARKAVDPAVARIELRRSLATCALTGRRFLLFDDGDDDRRQQKIVACPYGRLYDREAAVEALLRRAKRQQQKQKQQQHDDGNGNGNGAGNNDGNGSAADQLLGHVRGLKDLYDVRFHAVVDEDDRGGNGGDGGGHQRQIMVPACPVTSKVLNGTIGAYLVLPGRPDRPNVVSERALTSDELKDLVDSEYGPVETKIRLAPPQAALEEIKREWQIKVQLADENKSKDKKKKKKNEGDKKKKKEEKEKKRKQQRDDDGVSGDNVQKKRKE